MAKKKKVSVDKSVGPLLKKAREDGASTVWDRL